jgi:hypothetical protein
MAWLDTGAQPEADCFGTEYHHSLVTSKRHGMDQLTTDEELWLKHNQFWL